MIIYFTGTGNSRYAAEALGDLLGDQVFCCNDLIKTLKKGRFYSEKPYVFVFPVYLSIIPAILRKWILSSRFDGNSDAYFVPTCAGAAGSVPNIARKMCEESGYLTCKGTQMLVMPQNYVAHFNLLEEDKVKERLAAAREVIKDIAEVIKAGDDLVQKQAGLLEYGATLAVETSYNKTLTGTKKFYATEDCIGCGLCERKCPMNAIFMEDGKPIWVRTQCLHCMACINSCPKQAIQYGKGTVKKSRYICPRFTPDDLQS